MTHKTIGKARTEPVGTTLRPTSRRGKIAAPVEPEAKSETKCPSIATSPTKGTPQRLSAQLLNTLCADFEAHGADAIRSCREEQPQGYLRLIAGLLPKDFNLSDNRLKDIADDELDLVMELLREHAARSAGDGEREQGKEPPSR